MRSSSSPCTLNNDEMSSTIEYHALSSAVLNMARGSGGHMRCPPRGKPTTDVTRFQSLAESRSVRRARIFSARCFSSRVAPRSENRFPHMGLCGAASKATAHEASYGDSNQSTCRGSAKPAAAYSRRMADSARGRSAGSVDRSCASHAARISECDVIRFEESLMIDDSEDDRAGRRQA